MKELHQSSPPQPFLLQTPGRWTPPYASSTITLLDMRNAHVTALNRSVQPARNYTVILPLQTASALQYRLKLPRDFLFQKDNKKLQLTFPLQLLPSYLSHSHFAISLGLELHLMNSIERDERVRESKGGRLLDSYCSLCIEQTCHRLCGAYC